MITSSGYWSIYRERPGYQASAVDQYLAAHPKPTRNDQSKNTTSNSSVLTTDCPTHHGPPGKNDTACLLAPVLKRMRASPDLAAPGHNYPVVIGGEVANMDGTSASSPAIAALVALLNAEQKRRGEPPLGFLNPWLYQVQAKDPAAFVDVVVGNIASTEAAQCPWGYAAAPGWDPATGLGVPRFSALAGHLPRRAPQAMTAAFAVLHQGAGSDMLFGAWVQQHAALLLGSSLCAVALSVVLGRAALQRRRRPRQSQPPLSAAGHEPLLGRGARE